MHGVIVKSTGSWYQVLSDHSTVYQCRIKGALRLNGIKSTNPVSVGDKVDFEPEAKKNTGVITSIHDRKNYLIRKATNLSKQTHVIASNIDQIIILASMIKPMTTTGFIDRILITAEAYGIPAFLLYNKSDIYTPKLLKECDALVQYYSSIGYPSSIISLKNKIGIAKTKDLLKGKTTLLCGHSGTGKSTLINEVEQRLNIKTAPVSETHEKGTHTTTFAEMHLLTEGGYIIDTPGIKEFGLINMRNEELSHYFPEMRTLLNTCKYNSCTHVHEPECSVLKAVQSGTLLSSRYNTYISILQSNELKTDYK